jgi:hypothetical protein
MNRKADGVEGDTTGRWEDKLVRGMTCLRFSSKSGIQERTFGMYIWARKASSDGARGGVCMDVEM